MAGKMRSISDVFAMGGGLLVAAPAVLADTEIQLSTYVCEEVDPGEVRIGDDGTVHVRGGLVTGESVSNDARFEGCFWRRYNADLYPDGTADFWGVAQQRSHTYDGAWNTSFKGFFDGVDFSGRAAGPGERAFAGLYSWGVISLIDPDGSPCNPVHDSSQLVGFVTD